MSAFRVHVWKEWREQRAVLLVLALLGPLALFAVAPFVRCDPELLMMLCVPLAGLAGVLTVGSEILARETDGRLQFIERLPGGLAGVLRAKLAFYAASLLGLELVMLVAVHGVILWRSGEWPDAWIIGLWLPVLWLLTLAVSLWPLSASTWAPRGSLAAPLALFLLALLAWPSWGLPVAGYTPTTAEVVFLALGLFVAGLAATIVGFVRGRARGGSRAAAAARALAVLTLLSSPSWAWGLYKGWAFYRIDPPSSSFSLIRAELGDGGRFAFVVGCHFGLGWDDPPLHALQVDLATGAWTELGGPGTYLETVPRLEAGALDSWPDVPREHRLLDFDTREVLVRLNGLGHELPALDQPVRDWHAPAGLGYRDGASSIWDPFRRRLFRWRDLLPAGCTPDDTEVLVSKPDWLLASQRPPYWRRLDPESGAVTELGWPRGATRPGPMLADGRIFLLHDEGLLLADPRDGSLKPLSVTMSDVQDGRRLVAVWNAFGSRRAFRADQPVLLGTSLGILRVDVDALSATETLERDLSVVGALEGGTLVVNDGDRLLAFDGTGELRVLFPRPPAP